MPAIRTTPAVRVFLILNVCAILFQLAVDRFFGGRLLETFGLVPDLFLKKYYFWQILTYSFLHADLLHIVFNMLILWMIGSELEAQWGSRFFVRYYLICAMSGGLVYLLVHSLFHAGRNELMVGSSGAVYGLLVAYGILYSERVLLFMMVFPMKAKHFVMLLAAIEFVSTVFYSSSVVANAAHIGGMAMGFLYLYAHAWLRIRAKMAKSGKGGRRGWRRSHLRLVVNNEVLREFDEDDDSDPSSGRPTFH